MRSATVRRPTPDGPGRTFARAQLARVDELLPPDETWRECADARAPRCVRLRHVAGQRAFVAARVLARALTRDAGLVGPITQHCPTCHAPGHGRPTLPGGHAVSWAHSGGWVAAVVGGDVAGIDVEVARQPLRDADDLWALFGAADSAWGTRRGRTVPALLDVWVRKEALVKAGRLTLDTLDAAAVTDGHRLRGTVAGLVVSGRARDGVHVAVVSDVVVRWTSGPRAAAHRSAPMLASRRRA